MVFSEKIDKFALDDGCDVRLTPHVNTRGRLRILFEHDDLTYDYLARSGDRRELKIWDRWGGEEGII